MKSVIILNFFKGLLFAITTTGPALAFMLGSAMLRFYVDIDKVSRGKCRMI